jgi:hypothetical protein
MMYPTGSGVRWLDVVIKIRPPSWSHTHPFPRDQETLSTSIWFTEPTRHPIFRWGVCKLGKRAALLPHSVLSRRGLGPSGAPKSRPFISSSVYIHAANKGSTSHRESFISERMWTHSAKEGRSLLLNDMHRAERPAKTGWADSENSSFWPLISTANMICACSMRAQARL